MTFLLKATSQWIYIYLGQGQTLLQNAGFYVPSTTYFMPHTIRKVHSVNNDNEKVSITSYYGQSYPVVIKNFILTAKKLD